MTSLSSRTQTRLGASTRVDLVYLRCCNGHNGYVDSITYRIQILIPHRTPSTFEVNSKAVQPQKVCGSYNWSRCLRLAS